MKSKLRRWMYLQLYIVVIGLTILSVFFPQRVAPFNYVIGLFAVGFLYLWQRNRQRLSKYINEQDSEE